MTNLKRLVRWALTVDWSAVEPLETTTDRGHARIDLLWREGAFQIERVELSPHAQIPKHRHPHVDSWEIYLAGSGEARVGNRTFRVDPAARFPALWIPRTAWHGGHAGPVGGRWLSVQFWHETPGSLADDWQEED